MFDVCRFALATVFFAVAAGATADEWPRFRGPEGRGIAALDEAPTEWSQGDYAWVVTLPGVGHSSPAIRDGRLFLTSGTAEGKRVSICLDATTGKTIWTRELTMAPSHLHKKNSYGSGTPAVGDEGMFVLFSDGDQYVCVGYSVDGEELWKRDLGTFESQHGQGCSAILHKGMVIVPNDQIGGSSIAALDAKTGEIVWQTEKTARKAAYATPVVMTLSDREVLITLSGAEGVSGFDPATGAKLFASGEVPLRVVASPIIAEGAIIISCGSGGIGKHMEAIVPAEKGGSWTVEKRWVRNKMLPYVPTPVVFDGTLFLWNDGGTIASVDPITGEDFFKERIGGNYSGSPILIGSRLYAISEDGDVKVIDASREFRTYPGGKIDDYSYATPAVANGRIYFRGFSSLACLNAAQ